MKHIQLFMLVTATLLILSFINLKHTLSGIVVDENNQPIVAASVNIKATQKGTTTDKNGRFTIKVENNDVLIFTAVGFMQAEVKAGSKTNLTVVLKKATINLNEVVVIGYGTQNKRIFTGAEVASYSATPASGDVANLSMHLRGNGIYPRPGENGRYNNNFEREGYDNIKENPFLKAADNPLSTFSIDVDGASYSNIRRFINAGQLPPEGAVRIEEMINYFSYQYPQPKADQPFSINTEYAICPWNTQHHLVSIGLQGKKIATENLPAANIVFLIDVSGSMMTADKLPLVQASMKLLTDQLRPQDKVAIVVYAGNAGLVLPATPGNEKLKIKNAIDGLQAGGSTAGGAGIALAYKVAMENFIKKGNNRVVLCTDGDFNVGQSSDDALERLIEQKRESGIFLTVLGYGTGNYQDAKMQKLADKGNGNHAYIDNLNEARKVLISQFGGTMFTIAKDVKLQVEFNPAVVQGYRLIGYENRILAKEDFNDDKKDAGELGSGHTVTALYEIIPVGVPAAELKTVDGLKYQKPAQQTSGFTNNNEVMTVKFRYKKPDSEKSVLLQEIIHSKAIDFSKASENFHLSAAVAQFGMLLRKSDFKGNGGFDLVKRLLSKTLAVDEEGYKNELIQLVKTASLINNNVPDNDLIQTDKAVNKISKGYQ